LKIFTAAIKAGNSKELAKYFGPTVEIILPGSDGAFSKAQAEMIMKDFFDQIICSGFVCSSDTERVILPAELSL